MEKHCYLDRRSKRFIEEKLIGDNFINFLYSRIREKSSTIFNAATSKTSTKLLKYFNYNKKLTRDKIVSYCKMMGIDMNEIYDDYTLYTTLQDIFERRIKYWEYRPMPDGEEIVVSPADAKMIPGSFKEESAIFIKDKFFILDDLLLKEKWVNRFVDGDFAVFRLTPEEYHYNHSPVSGKVIDIYEIEGAYHSCNPTATISIATPLSLNRRIVTIIDTDIDGGTKVGLVAFVEIIAMMIGDIKQVYSVERYDNPSPIKEGDFIKKGQPKSVYRPGSSTDVVIFERDRIVFDEDILAYSRKSDISSRYSTGFNIPLVEIKVRVREQVARRKI